MPFFGRRQALAGEVDAFALISLVDGLSGRPRFPQNRKSPPRRTGRAEVWEDTPKVGSSNYPSLY